MYVVEQVIICRTKDMKIILKFFAETCVFLSVFCMKSVIFASRIKMRLDINMYLELKKTKKNKDNYSSLSLFGMSSVANGNDFNNSFPFAVIRFFNIRYSLFIIAYYITRECFSACPGFFSPIG